MVDIGNKCILFCALHVPVPCKGIKGYTSAYILTIVTGTRPSVKDKFTFALVFQKIEVFALPMCYKDTF